MLNVTTIMYCRHVASEGTVGYQLHASNTVYDLFRGQRWYDQIILDEERSLIQKWDDEKRMQKMAERGMLQLYKILLKFNLTVLKYHGNLKRKHMQK